MIKNNNNKADDDSAHTYQLNARCERNGSNRSRKGEKYCIVTAATVIYSQSNSGILFGGITELLLK